MKIFKHKENEKHYTIEILKSPFPFLDGSSRLGVWATPYLWDGETIFSKKVDFTGSDDDFINCYFTEIAYF